MATRYAERLREAAASIRNDGTPAQVGLSAEECDEIAAAITALEAEVAEARDLAERLKTEAQCHASEARTANSTIYEIYQVLSGGKGEPGNWNGAEPARAYVAAAEARINAILDFGTFSPWLRDWCKRRFGKWITHNTAKGALNDLRDRASSIE